ncbi:MAG: tautomerase family protein [Hyphomonas sp.]|nr:tautomerase family protein [Hyphomonas sp.]
MPLIQVWMRSGKDNAYKAAMSKGIHKAMMDVMKLPEDDYFQVTCELEEENYIFDPNYFGMPRSPDFLMIRLSFNARPAAMKQALFEAIADNLVKSPGLRREDLGMSIVETTFENWWAHGRRVDKDTGTDARIGAA